MPRQTRWVDTYTNFQLAMAGGVQVSQTLMANQTLIQTRGWTLTRIIGHFQAVSHDEAGGPGIYSFDCGILVASQEAVTAAVFADPETESDFPSSGWIWRDRIVVSQNVVNIPGGEAIPPTRFDIRAQRKLGNGTVQLVIDPNALRGAAGSMDLVVMVRCLFLMA